MAEITLDALKTIRGSYATLPSDVRPENPVGQCTHREYTFQEAVQTPIYKITNKTDAEIVSSFAKFTSSSKTSMTEEDFYDFINIALNVVHPVDKTKPLVAVPFPGNKLCNDYETAKPSTSGSVRFDKLTAATVIPTIVPSSQPTSSNATEVEPQSEQSKAISFLFAWLTRFSVKSPSTALDAQYNKVEETYLKFYQTSSRVFRDFRPSSEWIMCLREAFDAFLRVKCTLILQVAWSESKYKTVPKIFNVFRFLFYQNLEFMGMHAYVSIVAIMSKVALPPAQILTWLRMSGAELAIDEVHHIMSHFDNGIIQDGVNSERLWKYARCIDQGYFNRLQTTYAKELVATLAYIEIYLGISQESGYASPLNIYSIANNKHIKEIGRAKAESFMECKNAIISLSADASVVDRVYASKFGKLINLTQPTTGGPSPMETDTPSAKRPAGPAQDVQPEARKKKAPPQIKLTGVPNY